MTHGSWIVLAEAPFIPAMGGGEREHLGFVQSVVAEGRLGALVIPADEDPERYGRADDITAIRELCGEAPVFMTSRSRSARAALGLRPYVHQSRPFSTLQAREVLAAVPDATAIVSFSYKTAHMAKLLHSLSGLPVLVRMHNLEGRYFQSIASSTHGKGKIPAWVEAMRIAVDERLLERSPWVSGIADISRADAELRSTRASRPVRYVPTFALGPGREPSHTLDGSKEDLSVLFLGALDVRTNVDACEWFAKEVWPRVLNQAPNAVWKVVGRAPSQDIVSLAARTPRLELHADVPDPAVYYASATVAVNPAISGSGVNIKLVEYLAAGTPVVSTTLGSQGLSLEAGHDLIVVDSAADFAEQVLTLLQNPEAALNLGEQGRQTAQEMLDVRRSLGLMTEMLRAWVDSPQPG